MFFATPMVHAGHALLQKAEPSRKGEPRTAEPMPMVQTVFRACTSFCVMPQLPLCWWAATVTEKGPVFCLFFVAVSSTVFVPARILPMSKEIAVFFLNERLFSRAPAPEKASRPAKAETAKPEAHDFPEMVSGVPDASHDVPAVCSTASRRL
ncbi:MAG: hypothetical protein II595_06130 [Desulfovibrio sp.]|nr:hypothetical protein [Desulfovibrio sp.]